MEGDAATSTGRDGAPDTTTGTEALVVAVTFGSAGVDIRTTATTIATVPAAMVAPSNSFLLLLLVQPPVCPQEAIVAAGGFAAGARAIS